MSRRLVNALDALPDTRSWSLAHLSAEKSIWRGATSSFAKPHGLSLINVARTLAPRMDRWTCFA